MSDDRTLFLGVDPGASGGLAILDSAGAVVDVSPMPETEKDVLIALLVAAGLARELWL